MTMHGVRITGRRMDRHNKGGWREAGNSPGSILGQQPEPPGSQKKPS